MSIATVKSTKYASWLVSHTDFDWLRQQALDEDSLRIIGIIESDEIAFHADGAIPTDTSILRLNLRQGVFYTSRATSHSIASTFVHIFKNHDHLKADVPRILLNTDSPVIVDIGANEGFFTVFVASHVPSARVIAIEPNEIAYKFMQKNIAANKLSNISLIRKAIWNINGYQMLNVIPEATTIGTMTILENSYVNLIRERVVETPVETQTLDAVVKDFGLKRINLLKMDVEGSEYEILKSSRSMLHLIDYIVLEYHSQELKKNATQLLRSEGFELDFHDPDRESFGDIYFKNKHFTSN